MKYAWLCSNLLYSLRTDTSRSSGFLAEGIRSNPCPCRHAYLASTENTVPNALPTGNNGHLEEITNQSSHAFKTALKTHCYNNNKTKTQLLISNFVFFILASPPPPNLAAVPPFPHYLLPLPDTFFLCPHVCVWLGGGGGGYGVRGIHYYILYNNIFEVFFLYKYL